MLSYLTRHSCNGTLENLSLAVIINNVNWEFCLC